MKSAFLDASVLLNQENDVADAYIIKQSHIRFEFPNGFEQLRLIEECRAMNALDLTDPDNFDFMYDITMQMLVGKPVFIYFFDANDVKHEVARFVVTNRYMNLRGIDIIDEYPIIVNWLVEFIAGHLRKKFPRSLKDIQDTMNERKEHMKSLSKTQNQEKMQQQK